MRSVFFGRMLFVVILAWTTLAVLGSAPVAAQNNEATQTQGEPTLADYPVGYSCVPPKGIVIENLYCGKSQSPIKVTADGTITMTVTAIQVENDPKSGRPTRYPVVDVTGPNGQTCRGYTVPKTIQEQCGEIKTTKSNEGNTGTSNEDKAFTQAGIPLIPTRDDAWVSIPTFGIFLAVAPSTMVRIGKPNGFKIWIKIVGMGGASYLYTQFDCEREATRRLASKMIESGQKEWFFKVETELWSYVDDKDYSKILLNYCNEE